MRVLHTIFSKCQNTPTAAPNTEPLHTAALIYQERPDIALYAEDVEHPAPDGTALAAACIFTQLWGLPGPVVKAAGSLCLCSMVLYICTLWFYMFVLYFLLLYVCAREGFEMDIWYSIIVPRLGAYEDLVLAFLRCVSDFGVGLIVPAGDAYASQHQKDRKCMLAEQEEVWYASKRRCKC